ncbi:MAG: hypothetical protein LBI45_02155 [Bacteroidales bacterium]|jgi:ElaB/YqjD/DUF883 family membrane-anchored ribosome-binding protein|nr:hypothetical protein [Bacteroidales bacterium]
MRSVYLLIILTLFLTGCKTVKNNIREKSKTEVSIQNDTKENITISEGVKVSDNVTRLTDEFVTIIEKIITVKLSAPDSLNNQYPTKVTATEREISKGKTIKDEVSGSIEQTKNSEIQKTDNSTECIKAVSEKTDKTVTEKRTPGWVYVVAIIFSVGILIIIFLFLKKYRII